MKVKALPVCAAVLLSCLAAGTQARGLPRPATDATATCDECLFTWRLLDDVLSDAAVLPALVNLVETNVCSIVPAATSGKCRNLAEGLLPVVVQWLRAPATAYQFCHAASLCGTGGPKQKPDQAALPRDASQCALCKLVVFQAQQALNNTDVLDTLNKTAQQACALLPPDMGAVCTDMVNKYEPLLMELITNTPPQEVCDILGVCDAQLLFTASEPQVTPHDNAKDGDAVMPLAAVAAAMKRKRAREAGLLPGATLKPQFGGAAVDVSGPFGDTCDVCKMAVIEAHSLVASPQVQQSLVNYTESLCSGAPSFKDTCILYVDTYAPVVFSLLEQYLASPDAVCTQIGVCAPSLAAALLDQLRSYARAAVSQHQQGITPLAMGRPAALA